MQATTDSPTPPPPRRRRRLLRALGWTGAGLAGALLVAGAYGWWWSGQPHSLASALGLASRFLPEGQQLAFRDAEGALRHGGRLGWLQWQGPGMRVEISALELRYRLAPLLSRQVLVERLQIGKLQLVPGQAPQPTEPSAPLHSLTLPVDIELPFEVGEIAWGADPGAPALQVLGLRGHYQYAQARHRLRLDGVDVAGGRYQGDIDLQGDAPMALRANVAGSLAAPMAEGVAPLQVKIDAQAEGTLAQPDGQLAVHARVAPESDAEDGMRAQIQADIAPWQSQPVLRAEGAFQQIDAARLWPGLPRTALSGSLQAGPVAATAAGGTAWQAQVQAENAEPGPWDQQRLPLGRLAATARLDGQEWTVPEARLALGQGQVTLQGRYAAAPAPAWQVEARVQQLRPDQLYSTLDATPVSGQLRADQQATTIRFDADLAAQAGGRRAGQALALRLDQLRARGQYLTDSQALTLEQLRVEAAEAQLEGQLRARLDTRSGAGQLRLQAPGLQARLEGDMAPERGQAQTRVQLDNAGQLQRWLQRLPGLEQALSGLTLDGNARLGLDLQGGWADWQRQIERPGSAQRGLAVQAALDAPRLDVRPPPTDGQTPDPIALRTVTARLDGQPSDLRLQLDGQASMGTQQLALRTRASGGIAGPDSWRIALAELQATASGVPGASPERPWRLQLAAPLDASVRRNGAGGLRVEASAGQASLAGPGPEPLQLDWQPLLFIQPAAAPAGATGLPRLRSSGRVRGLSMAWAEALAGAQLQSAGLSGDLVFDGQWDIDTTEALRASARLARRSGDLMVRAGEAALVRRIHSVGTGTRSETRIDGALPAEAPATPAGIERAELALQAEGEAVRAQLAWDSQRAGTLSAELGTRLTRSASGGYALADDAPLSGRLQARVPDIGAWSMFAPPAWRIDGTLMADATLSGTRAVPQWNGQLQADGLAIRAAVEGLELKDGRLRARLQGNRLTLDELTLQGGAASRARIAGPSGNLSTVSSEAARDGGELRVSGELRWDGASSTESGIQMDLRARLRALRLLVRSDRQVTVSGDLQAGLAQNQLRLRGAVTTDRGVIILPDETAPTLGTDVEIHSAAKAAEQAARQAREQQQAERQARAEPRLPPDIAVSVDLGRDFAVQGHGLTTRLAGQLDVVSNAGTGGQPRVTGEIRTVQGRYRAYGQQLDVESGLVRFNGPVDNPALDILAIRPNLEQKAGVQVTGSVQAPRVALYSQPPLSDAETLSWMLLGRSTAGGGAEAAVMQQAALALLGGFGPKGGGGDFASKLGLDEIGFSGGGSGENSGAAITLGKRLSDQVYVTYEASLAGSMGTLYIFYDLTRNLALRGQAGFQSGLDLIYTIRYD